MNGGRCVACGGDLTLFGPRLTYEYHVCRSCGTIQLHPQPSVEFLKRAYETDYARAKHSAEFADPEVWGRTARPFHEAIVSALKSLGVTDGVVDVGAGWGALCARLLENGIACTGVEPSTQMSAYAQSKGLPVVRGDLSSLNDRRGAVRALTLSGVFEHLIDHDAWLRDVAALLAPGGVIVSLQPTAGFYRLLGTAIRLGRTRMPLPELYGTFAPPWHTVLFSRSGMRTLARRNGFDVVDVRRAPQRKAPGFVGLVQRAFDAMNRIGWAVAGERWPAVNTHIFVLRKVG